MPVIDSRKHSGFTLLEAVIALTILASGATALYAWVNSNMLTLNRIHAINQAADATRNVLEELAASNPEKERQLQMDYGDSSIRIQRELSKYSAPAIGDDGRYSVNDAALYKTTITVTKENQLQARFQLWELGLTPARTIDEVLF